MKKLLNLTIAISILISSLGIVPLAAQTSSINKTQLDKKIDSLFKEFNKTTSPGCAITVIENGKVVSKIAYGMASIEHQVPFTHQSVVTLPYSEAREFISIAAVLMEKDGVLKLTDKVRNYFPDLPEWSAQVTLWDLLNHRSGFVDEWATLLLMHNSMANRFEKEQFLRLLYTQPNPQVEPGKGYMYCNSDFGLLRLILEKASGKYLPDWMKERMFERLNMKSTSMQISPLDIIPNHSIMYDDSFGERCQHASIQKTSPGGNYYILTSANDLEQWLVAINDPDTELNQAAATLMSNVRQIPGRVNHYVVGYSTPTINNYKVIIHEGVNGYNYLSRIPSKGLAVITLGNRHFDGFGIENKAIVNYLLKVAPPSLPKLLTQPINVNERELKKYTGNYRWQEVSWESYQQSRKFSTFFIADGKLKVRYTGNYVIDLIPVAKDIFYYEEGFGLQFVFSQSTATAPLQVVTMYDDGYPGELMIKNTEVAWNPAKEILARFVGKYYSKHLDFFWTIVINDKDQLVLHRSTLPDTIIEPDGPNQFHYIGEKSPGVGFDQWIRFNSNAKGVSTGFTVWSARVMHHEFEKVD